MNALAPRPVPTPHRVRLVPSVVALAGLVVLLAASAACSGIGAGNQAPSSRVCADKVAQASVSGSVPGLWKCLTPDFQISLASYGSPGDGALVATPFASRYVSIGSTPNAVYYELILLPAIANQQGFHEMALVVWLDQKTGKVAAFSTGSSPS